ncbi:hypothetical protein [Streptomyces sp. NPDC127098]|uniref:hypothetical protein n=1 Tax=Streptomyces sp. NPDC127098 TaxID=3347137 RepID=UPI003660D007
MDPTVSSLVVAVVGVLGTLLSGLLAHRGALRSKALELDRQAGEREAERQALERRELRELRRSSYATLNQALRQFHLALSRHHRWLTEGTRPSPETPDLTTARDTLRLAYADAQMVASDAVLKAGGDTYFLLLRLDRLLTPEATPEQLDDAASLLRQGSEGLYEARQTMRRDLGITDLPIARPEGHGRLRWRS